MNICVICYFVRKKGDVSTKVRTSNYCNYTKTCDHCKILTKTRVSPTEYVLLSKMPMNGIVTASTGQSKMAEERRRKNVEKVWQMLITIAGKMFTIAKGIQCDETIDVFAIAKESIASLSSGLKLGQTVPEMLVMIEKNVESLIECLPSSSTNAIDVVRLTIAKECEQIVNLCIAETRANLAQKAVNALSNVFSVVLHGNYTNDACHTFNTVFEAVKFAFETNLNLPSLFLVSCEDISHERDLSKSNLFPQRYSSVEELYQMAENIDRRRSRYVVPIVSKPVPNKPSVFTLPLYGSEFTKGVECVMGPDVVNVTQTVPNGKSVHYDWVLRTRADGSYERVSCVKFSDTRHAYDYNKLPWCIIANGISMFVLLEVTPGEKVNAKVTFIDCFSTLPDAICATSMNRYECGNQSGNQSGAIVLRVPSQNYLNPLSGIIWSEAYNTNNLYVLYPRHQRSALALMLSGLRRGRRLPTELWDLIHDEFIV